MPLSRIEKVLVGMLVGCLLTGAGWAMLMVEDKVPRPVLQHGEITYQLAGQRVQQPAVEDEMGVTPYRQRVDHLQEQQWQQGNRLGNGSSVVVSAL